MAEEPRTFVFPVGEVYLTPAVNKEYRINRVTLVDRGKLPLIRKRLGFGRRVSALEEGIPGRDFFKSAPTFTVVRQSGVPKEVTDQCLGILREEFAILSLSQLGYSNRRQMGPVVFSEEVDRSRMSLVAVSAGDQSPYWAFKTTKAFSQIVLGRNWKNFQNKVFFTNLLKIIRLETLVDKSWRNQLYRAAVMLGESVGSPDLLKAFIWNMCVLEMLLTESGSKMLDTLPRRAEAFLGWVGFWGSENYEDRIKDVYKKRNRLLHDGDREEISEEDLEFTDELVLNLLTNLVGHPQLFRSKKDVTSFSQKVEAERTLGVTPRTQPKSFKFVKRRRP